MLLRKNVCLYDCFETVFTFWTRLVILKKYYHTKHNFFCFSNVYKVVLSYFRLAALTGKKQITFIPNIVSWFVLFLLWNKYYLSHSLATYQLKVLIKSQEMNLEELKD